MVLEIIIIKFSCILKMMSRNTFPEPQPDSASYPIVGPTIIPVYPTLVRATIPSSPNIGPSTSPPYPIV